MPPHNDQDEGGTNLKGKDTKTVTSPTQFKARVAAAGSHYFSPNTMRFFNSRLHSTRIVSGDLAYFVTSKQQDHMDGTSEPRGWTARVARFERTADERLAERTAR